MLSCFISEHVHQRPVCFVVLNVFYVFCNYSMQKLSAQSLRRNCEIIVEGFNAQI